MMSMGVPGIVAVASNICHKFPKLDDKFSVRYGETSAEHGGQERYIYVH
jgi:hypothetical protein